MLLPFILSSSSTQLNLGTGQTFASNDCKNGHIKKFFWLCWVFVAVQGLSLHAVSGGCSLAAVHRLRTALASLAVGIGAWASVAAVGGLNSCGSRA